MNSTQTQKLGGRIWANILLFGLIGQVAWMVENMYFNVFLYKTVTYDPNAAAVMVAASAVAATVTTLLMGGLSDKLGKRKLFLSGGYIFWGFSILAFAFLTKENAARWFPAANAAMLTTVFVVIMDCVMTFFGSTANDAAFNAWETDVTTEENRGRAEGVLSAMPLIAMLVVFGALDGLTQAGNWKAFFLLVGGIVSLCGVLGLFLVKDAPGLQPNPAPYVPNLVYGFRPAVVKDNGKLYCVFLALAVSGIASQVFMPYLMVYLEFGLGIKDYVIPLALVLVLAAAFSVLGGRLADKYGKRKFLLPAGIVFAIGMFLMYLQGRFHTQTPQRLQLLLLVVCGCILMGGSLLLATVLGASARDALPSDKRGHFLGVKMVFTVMLPMLIGPFIGSLSIRGAATQLDAYGEVQYIPHAGMFLWGGFVALLLLPLLVVIQRAEKRQEQE
ncbi:MAG: MFS transporter [Oscillospiraceae bacterium]|jgi:MFS family permease|nr:MFS transporter [Oscillospiraceae bacterium]